MSKLLFIMSSLCFGISIWAGEPEDITKFAYNNAEKKLSWISFRYHFADGRLGDCAIIMGPGIRFYHQEGCNEALGKDELAIATWRMLNHRFNDLPVNQKKCFVVKE